MNDFFPLLTYSLHSTHFLSSSLSIYSALDLSLSWSTVSNCTMSCGSKLEHTLRIMIKILPCENQKGGKMDGLAPQLTDSFYSLHSQFSHNSWDSNMFFLLLFFFVPSLCLLFLSLLYVYNIQEAEGYIYIYTCTL